MEKLSNLRKNNSFKSNREQVINFACSSTGLPIETVTKIYENQKAAMIPDADIHKYFTELVKPKESISSGDLMEVLMSIFNDVDPTKRDELVNKFINLLGDVENPESEIFMDSVNLVSLVRDILISVNPEAKEKLTNVISTSDLTYADFKSLNESFSFQVKQELSDNSTVKLYESLGTLLAKNNRRWGNNNALDNSYNAIMEYIKDEVETIQLNYDMYSIDKVNGLELINGFLSGNVNPILKDFSSCKTQIRDVQTLILDMILIVSKYIYSRNEDLSFVSRVTYQKYENSLNQVVPKLYSSIKESKILSDEFINQVFINNQTITGRENNLIDSNEIGYSIVKGVDLSKLRTINQNVYNLPVIGLLGMVNFIASASFDFNVKIRPLITNFVNSSRELLTKVDSARIAKSKLDGNIIR